MEEEFKIFQECYNKTLDLIADVDFELIRKYNWTYEDTKIINEHAQVFNLICILNGFAVDFKESDVLFSKNIQIHNKVS